MLKKTQRLISIVFLAPLFSCTSSPEQSTSTSISVVNITTENVQDLDTKLQQIVKNNKINTLGVAVINDGEIAWSNQYGMQSDTVEANASTLFNVASLTKPVVAETILRLVAQGKLSLDESVANYWVDPDLAGSPQVQKLTPRMLLSHTSGFMNWRYFSKERKLSFINPPGTTFGYSGEGFEYLAKYVENKLNTPFDDLVKQMIFEPLEMKNAHFTVEAENFGNIAKPYDIDGKFYGYYCSPYGYCAKEGSYSAAANLVITVDDYAKFLVSSMKGEGLSSELLADKERMQGVQFEGEDIICEGDDNIPCPTKLGYGLGWSMSIFDDEKLVGHRGTNWKAVSLAYYYPASRNGLVVFFNAPNQYGITGMVDVLELLDPDSPEILGYRLRQARFN